jgi:hypothetical protein
MNMLFRTGMVCIMQTFANSPKTFGGIGEVQDLLEAGEELRNSQFLHFAARQRPIILILHCTHRSSENLLYGENEL